MALPRSAVHRREDGLEHLAPRYAAAFLGLVRSGEVVRRELDRDLRDRHDIGLGAFEILLHLGAFSPDGSLRMAELTAQAPLSQSRVSRLVADLERRGLVVRDVDGEDSRGVVVTLTGEGAAVLEVAARTHLEGLDRVLFGRLTRAEVAELARLTDKVLGDEAPRTGLPRRPGRGSA
jgi:DNA-binding MarR family transcriptional regulator